VGIITGGNAMNTIKTAPYMKRIAGLEEMAARAA
jgi:hypothetical protein